MAETKKQEPLSLGSIAKAKTNVPSYTITNSTNRYSSLASRKADWEAAQPKPATPAAPAAPSFLSQDEVLSSQYQAYINKQKNSLDKASAEQQKNIQAMQDKNNGMIDAHLGAIKNAAGSSENAFLDALNKSNSAAAAANQARRDEFEAGNKQSLSNIANSQSQIQQVPGYTPVAQISNRPETVSGWNNLGSIGVKRHAIKLNTLTARFGFNTAQINSRKRQRLGVQGLRVGT